jgi:hypothetical protein
VAKKVPDCKNCTNFSPALDPQISMVYIGQCMKIEYPYAINIPKDGIEGECGYFEKT